MTCESALTQSMRTGEHPPAHMRDDAPMTNQESNERRLQQANGSNDEPRGLFGGFEGYRTPTEDDYRRVFTEGLVVPDSNVLLNLYRYNEQTRSDLVLQPHFSEALASSPVAAASAGLVTPPPA
jgi:hypothetical protein